MEKVTVLITVGCFSRDVASYYASETVFSFIEYEVIRTSPESIMGSLRGRVQKMYNESPNADYAEQELHGGTILHNGSGGYYQFNLVNGMVIDGKLYIAATDLKFLNSL